MAIFKSRKHIDQFLLEDQPLSKRRLHELDSHAVEHPCRFFLEGRSGVVMEGRQHAVTWRAHDAQAQIPSGRIRMC
ncbi:MAG: hypothetical protein A3H95_04315 [Acidobacteria bacterium RIFCSPLOWO2_02_FULL_64_15]|nr:MAG: hypothetical protein A3H95_04315 [Acidobacteria bacterium RIFCSPLOWO2_02_FULL_64_15]